MESFILSLSCPNIRFIYGWPLTMFPWADSACSLHLHQQVQQWKGLVVQKLLPLRAHCTCNPVSNQYMNRYISNKQPFVMDKTQHQALILPRKNK